MTYYLIIIGICALCVPLLIGLIVAARQRPTRHDKTLEHIEELEKELGMGEVKQLEPGDRATLPPGQVGAERARSGPE